MEKEVTRKRQLEVETMNFDDRISNRYLSVQEGIQSYGVLSLTDER